MKVLDFKLFLENEGFNHYATDDTYSYQVVGEDMACMLVADFKKQEIRWPTGMVVNDKTTSNFEHEENFVVFECVHRLLEMGYHPKDIELEPKWKVGHGMSGGKADIWVRTKKPGESEYESLLIIECKTFGREFNSAWKDTEEDGDQLFGYFAQEPSTKFLCLYASDYIDDKLTLVYHLINVQDNEESLKSLKSPISYKDGKSRGRKHLFKAWKETYKGDYATIGLFEKGIEAYHPGKSEYTVDDLKAVDAVEIGKLYHRFAETLRKYNVSGRENAFDKLVNLMLAKVVDELQNPKLQFNWKGAAYDDDFRLQDRLQKLYKEGMQKFLGEDVTYIDDKQIDRAFCRFKSDPDATRDAVRKFVRQLKFFTNNDFAFIDVHNEKLFNQNSVVLREVVRMLQDIRLRTNSGNQFLGDLFENFLDQGVKQSEGQFFTPIPYVRFMVSSLPIAETIVKMPDPPIMLDYACGAGHLLNEYARQGAACLKLIGEKYSLDKFYDNIFGIEKEYRLSKVSKVASFMYGQDEIHIIYADALVKNDQVKDGTVTFLATNPPYSVKGFLETLTEEERNRFWMFRGMDEKQVSSNDDIECFFIERAAQLLAPGGMAAIVLPSSILNNGGIYERSRDVLLESFDVVGIVEMGNGTFGKTNTSTATLFLRRKESNPSPATHIRNRVTSWFKGDFSKDAVFKDADVRAKYAGVIGVSAQDYDEFLKGGKPKTLMESEMFAAYVEGFKSSTRAKNILKKRLRSKYTAADRQKEFEDFIISEIRAVEAEKLRVFMLAEDNPQPVVVVKGPVKSGEIKKFLGYEWSSRKGEEGMHIIGAEEEDEDGYKGSRGIEQIQTPLFNPGDMNDPNRICMLIRNNFDRTKVTVPADLSDYVTVIPLSNTINFRRRDFDKVIRTSGFEEVNIESRFESESISSLVETTGGLWKGEREPLRKVHVLRNTNFTLSGEIDYSDVAEMPVEESSYEARKLLPGDVIIEKSGGSDSLAVGRVVLFDRGDGDFSFSNFTARLRIKNKNKLLPYYLHLLLNTLYQMGASYRYQHGASGIKNLRLDDYLAKKIPVPPLADQKKLVAACEKFDRSVSEARKEIATLLNKKESSFDGLKSKNRVKLASLCKAINPPKSEVAGVPDGTMVTFVDMPSVSNDGYIASSEERDIQSVKKGGYTYFAEGDVIVAKITPCMENGKCALTAGLKNGIGFGSSEFHVFRPKNDVLGAFLFYFINRAEVRKAAEKAMTGASGHKRVPISFYEALEVPALSLAHQRNLVASIGRMEDKIATLKKLIDDCKAKKAKLVEDFLK